VPKPSAYYNRTMNPDPSQKRNSSWHTVRDWLQTIIIALIIALPIRYFIAEPFIVSGASMDPAFASGQFLIVDRLSYELGDPNRDDVIVFKYPNNPSVYYIKRIIGLPGETVKIADGRVTIVNQENPDGFILNEQFIETDHASHDSLIAMLGPKEYFVMGDNRAQSSDSRIWGSLDRSYIIGRPVLRLLPVPAITLWPGKYEDSSSQKK
jgi:signal peptidase I